MHFSCKAPFFEILMSKVVSNLESSVSKAAHTDRTLEEYESRYIVGRRKEAKEIRLRFDQSEFFHLCGLHKLNDIAQLDQKNRKSFFEKLQRGVITDELCRKSKNYQEISDRILLVERLDQFLDSNDFVFKYTKGTRGFELTADYALQKGKDETEAYVFIEEGTMQRGKKRVKTGFFFCKSCFPRSKDPDGNLRQSKTAGCPEYKLLLKEKINLKTGEIQLLFRSPSYHENP